MKRATMTLPDDLAEAVEAYVQAQEAPPSLTAVTSGPAGLPVETGISDGESAAQDHSERNQRA